MQHSFFRVVCMFSPVHILVMHTMEKMDVASIFSPLYGDFTLLDIHCCSYSAEKMDFTFISYPIFADFSLVETVVLQTVQKNRLLTSISIHWMHFDIPFLFTICRPHGRFFLCRIHLSYPIYHVLRWFFSVLKYVSVYSSWEYCNIHTIIAGPTVSIDRLFFCATGKWASTDTAVFLRSMDYSATCCQSSCYSFFSSYLGSLSNTLASAPTCNESLKRLLHS